MRIDSIVSDEVSTGEGTKGFIVSFVSRAIMSLLVASRTLGERLLLQTILPLFVHGFVSCYRDTKDASSRLRKVSL